jgi:hypothetical protein
MAASDSPALPVAHVLLRILIVLNWLMGAAIMVLLLAMPTRQWIMSALELSSSPETDRIILGLRTIAVIGLATIPINHVILRRLLQIVETVRSGDAFDALNAVRLRTIAWAVLALQLIGLVIGAIASKISTSAHPLNIDAGFSITGWLAVLLLFVLSRVFAEGARMRDELEGTV